MLNQSPKYLYAQAVLSGAMTKSAAFTRFINTTHHNPSQGAYRLEQTQSMRELMDNVRGELTLTRSIRQKQLLMMERSLDLMNGLLEGGGHKTAQERLATLRLAKTLSHGIKRPLINTDDEPGMTSKSLDRASVIS